MLIEFDVRFEADYDGDGSRATGEHAELQKIIIDGRALKITPEITMLCEELAERIHQHQQED